MKFFSAQGGRTGRASVAALQVVKSVDEATGTFIPMLVVKLGVVLLV